MSESPKKRRRQSNPLHSQLNEKPKKKAKWTTEEIQVLVEKINAGERVSDIKEEFPGKTLQNYLC